MGDLSDAVSLVAVLTPGLFFEIGLSSRFRSLRSGLGARLYRLLALSVAYHVALLPLSIAAMALASDLLASPTLEDALVAWPIGLCYSLAPYLLGLFVGSDRGRRRIGAVAPWLAGSNSAPTAWEEWLSRSAGTSPLLARVLLTDEIGWVAGYLAYASDDPQDLWLSPAIACDRTTGEVATDDLGRPISLQAGHFLQLDKIVLITAGELET